MADIAVIKSFGASDADVRSIFVLTAFPSASRAPLWERLRGF
jgi:hypothetical protein